MRGPHGPPMGPPGGPMGPQGPSPRFSGGPMGPQGLPLGSPWHPPWDPHGTHPGTPMAPTLGSQWDPPGTPRPRLKRPSCREIIGSNTIWSPDKITRSNGRFRKERQGSAATNVFLRKKSICQIALIGYVERPVLDVLKASHNSQKILQIRNIIRL